MLRRIAWLVLIILLAMALPCHARGETRVMVLPFEVNSLQDLAYLQEEVPKIIIKNLSAEGATIIASPIQSVLADPIQIREMGVENGVDFIIWGSLTWIDQQFSIDVRVLSPFEETPVETLTVEGRGIEALSGKIGDLSQELTIQLFDLVAVVDIKIEGNERIEAAAILPNISTEVGDTFIPKTISEDLKAVYKMGYFSDVRVNTADVADGKIVIFQVKEKPTILGIGINGNTVFDNEEIRENITLKSGSVLNQARVRINAQVIEDLYKEKNYHNAKVDYEINTVENNQANIEFIITEGEEISIESIRFVGNQTFDEDDLKDIMRTKEKDWLSWVTGAGELDLEKLNQDVISISSYYQNNGFINIKVSDPSVVFKEDEIEITIKVSEGDRYKVGQVDIDGDLIKPKETLLDELKIPSEEYFNRGLLEKDVLHLTDVYGDEGYAYAGVIPRTIPDPRTLTVDVTYAIEKRQLVYFDEIIIGGNTVTRDKVIRRELLVIEQELYNRTKLKAGIKRLHGLGYFEDVKVNTLKGDTDDQMILKIDVSEKPTGQLTFGGGFGSEDGVFGVISVDEKNLWGLGHKAKAAINLGGESTRFDVTYTNPWMFDIPLTGWINIYKWDKEWTDYGYDKDSYGIRLGVSYPVFYRTRLTLSYLLDNSDIKITDESEASSNILELEGENITSSVTANLRYDSRDRGFNTTRGSTSKLEVEYAGLGGDFNFTKYTAETAWYWPLFWKLVGMTRAQGGYISGDDDDVPDYEKFYIGGMSTIRGVEKDDISRREDPADPDSPLVGGEKYAVFNVELTFPIGEEMGLYGVAFYDTGNVWEEGQDVDFGELVSTAGGGLRWQSPFGALRLEYGFVIDSADTDASGGKLEFTMGQSF
jgi:outer membrane protein insertion porin family